MYLQIRDAPVDHHAAIRQISSCAIEKHLEQHPNATEDECLDIAYNFLCERYKKEVGNIKDITIRIYQFEKKDRMFYAH